MSLFDRFQNIKDALDDVLQGGMGPFAKKLTLPYSALSWEMEPLVGILNVCLAEARMRLDLPAPDGFAVTAAGCRLFLETNGLDEDLLLGDPVRWEKTISEARFPPDLESSIGDELKSLLDRQGSHVLLSVRACAAGGYGKRPPDVEGVTGISPREILPACKSAMAEFLRKSNDGTDSEIALALAVHEALPFHFVGTAGGMRSDGSSGGLLNVTAMTVENPDEEERYLLRRVYPFDLVQSEIRPKPLDGEFPPGAAPLSPTHDGLYHGSAFVEPAFLRTVAESVMTFERMLGGRQEMHWARKGQEARPIVLNVFPLNGTDDPEVSASNDETPPSDVEVLLRGGETVQSGRAAGKAVLVSEDDDPESFPHGAVAVAAAASPKLSAILRRASALITELGTSIGHLATIARELRVPAIFGLSGAMKIIRQGIEITVDAEERVVYRGVVESLLTGQEESAELYPGDPEYGTLRRLLRWIMPLNLIDPESSGFSAENCATYHDIIHFAHERSVEELLHLQARGLALSHLHARMVDLGVPLDLFVIDIGGGISPRDSGALSVTDVASEPFRAFLRGLTARDMWDTAPASLRLKDIFSGLDRTFAAMRSKPEYAGMNHAVVAENYMNMGLRLGYHFSVVDSYLGTNENQNYIYFRFVGGFADDRRRRLRAELLRTVLEDMRFKVLVKGDLVVGKLKIAGREEIAASLTMLGELTGFTRQLDISLASEEDVRQFVAAFRRKRSVGGAPNHDAREAGDG